MVLRNTQRTLCTSAAVRLTNSSRLRSEKVSSKRNRTLQKRVLTERQSHNPPARVQCVPVYQMRYLTGLVAGDKLVDELRTAQARPSLCVAYIAAYPIPEVQRGINAFTIGCRERFASCTVKVVWTGAETEFVSRRAVAFSPACA